MLFISNMVGYGLGLLIAVIGITAARPVTRYTTGRLALRGLRRKLAVHSLVFGPAQAHTFGLRPTLALHATYGAVTYTVYHHGDSVGFASGTVRNDLASVHAIDDCVLQDSARSFADANRAHDHCAICVTV